MGKRQHIVEDQQRRRNIPHNVTHNAARARAGLPQRDRPLMYGRGRRFLTNTAALQLPGPFRGNRRWYRRYMEEQSEEE